MEQVYLGRVVNFLSETALEDFNPGFLAVGETGTILDYGPWEAGARRRWRHVTSRNYAHSLVLPGFVDTHLHLPQMYLRGIYGADLLQWLEHYILPAEARFSDPRYARKVAREFFSELLKNGTTTALVYSSVHKTATDIAFREADRSGIRAIIGKVMMDRNSPPALQEPTARSLADSIALYEQWQGHDRNRLQYVFAPRFAPSCSEKLMTAVGRFAQDKGAYITSHLAETEPEVEITRKLFPKHASYTELYHDMNLLGPKTVMAHCIHLNDREYRLLARTQTRVAHCPSANLFLHSGSMDLKRMERERIMVGLGTDVGAGPSFSLFTVLQNTYFLRKITPVRAFYQATLGGARCLSLDKTTGSFAPGKDADFIVVDAPPLGWSADKKDAGAINEVLAQLMFRGDDRAVRASFVRGRCVHNGLDS